jgi:uncharacterized protein with GYD domain
MAKFVLFGKYSAEALKNISAARTEEAKKIVQKLGGSIEAIYALLGDVDLLILAELPGVNEAVQVSVALSKATGIAFRTAPAISVEEFDKLAEKI